MVRTLFISSIFALSAIVSAVPALLGGDGDPLVNVAADEYIGTGPIKIQDSLQDIVSARNVDLHDNVNDLSVLNDDGPGSGGHGNGGGIGGIGGNGNNLDGGDSEYPYSGGDLYPDAGDYDGGNYDGGDYDGGDCDGSDYNGGDYNGGDYNGGDYNGGDNDYDDVNGGDGGCDGSGSGRGRGRRSSRRIGRPSRVSRPPRVRGGCN